MFKKAEEERKMKNAVTECKSQGKSKRVMQKPMEMVNAMKSSADPSGSYTGNPQGADKKPVQDADDL